MDTIQLRSISRRVVNAATHYQTIWEYANFVALKLKNWIIYTTVRWKQWNADHVRKSTCTSRLAQKAGATSAHDVAGWVNWRPDGSYERPALPTHSPSRAVRVLLTVPAYFGASRARSGLFPYLWWTFRLIRPSLLQGFVGLWLHITGCLRTFDHEQRMAANQLPRAAAPAVLDLW